MSSSPASAFQYRPLAPSDQIADGSFDSGYAASETAGGLWQHLMRADPEAMPYQSPEWVSAACKSGDFSDLTRTYRTPDGAQYVLPLLLRNGRPRVLGSAGSMPHAWGMGGILGENAPTLELARAVFADLADLGLMSVQLRPNPRHAAIWSAAAPPNAFVVPRRAHVIDLRQGFDHVWMNKVSSRARNKIRKSERSDDVAIDFDDTGKFVDAFYHLFEQSLVRWAKAQHEPRWLARLRGRHRDPLAKFVTIARTLGRQFRIGLARIDGDPVAAIIVLQGSNANYSRGVMNVERVGNTGANELLLIKAIEHAAGSNCSFFHMGESGQSTSLAQFKEKLGADPLDYAEYRLERWPVSHLDKLARTGVKRLIGFKDGG